MQSTKEQEIPKCACNEKYCGVLTRFLQYVDLSFCKVDTRKMFGYNTIHFKSSHLVGLSNHSQRSKICTRRGQPTSLAALSCKGVIQVQKYTIM